MHASGSVVVRTMWSMWSMWSIIMTAPGRCSHSAGAVPRAARVDHPLVRIPFVILIEQCDAAQVEVFYLHVRRTELLCRPVCCTVEGFAAKAAWNAEDAKWLRHAYLL